MSAYILNAAKTMRNLKLKCGCGDAPFADFAGGQRSLSFHNTSNDPSSS